MSFNERSFPARNQNPPTTITPKKGSHLIGKTFKDEGEEFLITNCSFHKGVDCLDYRNIATQEETYSKVEEVEEWIQATRITQMANAIQPTRKGYMNTLAETMFREIQPTKYNVKLPSNKVKPPKNFNDARTSESQWFEAFKKERDGMLRFNTWVRIPQDTVTTEMRRHALRAHHIYNVKRDGSAKVRVVVNGKRQHDSTYSDTTSPVINQFHLRVFLAQTAIRKYAMIQMDLTNAYLHADIQDRVFIYIPQGFPGAGEIAKLDKATYGTKQGARRFYDHSIKVLKQIGFTQCKIEPCLFRYLHDKEAAFLILYVDDALIAGPQRLVNRIETNLKKYFDAKFAPSKLDP